MKPHRVSLLLALAISLGGLSIQQAQATGSAPPAQPPPVAAAAAPAPGMQRIDDPKAVYRVPVDDTPLRGPADALVTIVEFSDLECPFCKRVAPTMKQIEQTYRGKVRFAWKHNPLSMHRFAGPAAMVAEAARAKGAPLPPERAPRPQGS